MPTDESESTDTGLVRLDGSQLRCLAHPLRTRLLASLRIHGPATSAQLAARLDTNTGVTSYHLRQLADVGLVTEDETRGTARERWWQSAHRYSSWNDTDFDSDPDERAAAEWLGGHNARLKATWRDHWHATSATWTADWRSAASYSDFRLELTPDQLRSMNAEILAVIEHYRAAGPVAGDTQPVAVLLDTFPAPDLPI